MCYQLAPNDGTKRKKKQLYTGVIRCLLGKIHHECLNKYFFSIGKIVLVRLSIFNQGKNSYEHHYYWYIANRLMNSIIELYCLRWLFLVTEPKEKKMNLIVCVEKRVDMLTPSYLLVFSDSGTFTPTVNDLTIRDQTNVMYYCWIQKKKIENRKTMGKRGCKQIKNLGTEFNRQFFLVISIIMRRIFRSSPNSYHNSLETKQFMHIELDMDFFGCHLCALL